MADLGPAEDDGSAGDGKQESLIGGSGLTFILESTLPGNFAVLTYAVKVGMVGDSGVGE